MSIDYERFLRIVTRCFEVGQEVDAHPVVSAVFVKTFATLGAQYIAAEKAVSDAMTSFAKENREALDALAKLDGPYKVARSALVAVLPHVHLPDTLKSLKTDTDKLNAIERLVDLIDKHVGEDWADAILKSEFGTKAPKTIDEINEAIAANKGLAKANTERATLYGPMYERYLPFKKVVRNAYGPGSKQYRRIHLRASPGAKPEVEDEEEKVDDAPAPDDPTVKKP